MTSSLPEPGKSVGDLAPHLLKDWVPSKNAEKTLYEFKGGSGYVATWHCHVCSFEWTTTIANRFLRKSNCRKCARKPAVEAMRGVPKMLSFEKSIAFRCPELLSFWSWEDNNVSPENIGPGSEFRYTWVCERGHKTKGKVYSKLNGLNKDGAFPCKPCYLEDKTKPKPGRSLAEVNPGVAATWHPTLNGELTPADVYAHANRYAWWVCEHGHETYALINSKVNGYGCKDCNTYNMSQSEFRVREALQASGIFTELSDKQVTLDLRWRNRSVAEVDMLGTLPDGRQVVVEYDGAYHHANYPDVIERDLAKTRALVGAGYTVVRIREHDLFPVALEHPNLMQVQFPFNRLKPEAALPDLVRSIGTALDGRPAR